MFLLAFKYNPPLRISTSRKTTIIKNHTGINPFKIITMEIEIIAVLSATGSIILPSSDISFLCLAKYPSSRSEIQIIIITIPANEKLLLINNMTQIAVNGNLDKLIKFDI
ncbi:MAG TPA: hypothetical protein VGK25_06895 [Ignavibacteria bacterium]